MPKWSYSAIKQFVNCPKQYYHLRVAKDYKDEAKLEVTAYGTAFHKAAELYVKGEAPLPDEFIYAKETLDNLKAMPGVKYCEYEMGLTEQFAPCAFMAEDVWLRTIADLLIVDGDKAKLLDYKTGKSAKYADKGQLELMALAVFEHFPEVKHIKAGLLFVVAREFITEKYSREQKAKLWEKWLKTYTQLNKAHEVNKWNAKLSGLCKQHCVVTECPYNGRN